ncbi:hypothetical protein AKJ16_DCAP04460 [Drosera capensis]
MPGKISNFDEVFAEFKAESAKYKANLILFLADKDPSTSLDWCRVPNGCSRLIFLIKEKYKGLIWKAEGNGSISTIGHPNSISSLKCSNHTHHVEAIPVDKPPT